MSSDTTSNRTAKDAEEGEAISEDHNYRVEENIKIEGTVIETDAEGDV